MKISQQEIQIIQHYFADKPVKKAFIFGSQARGDANELSDIDILVELDYSKYIGLGFVTMQQDLEDQLHKKVDLISEKALSKYILPFVESDKQLIYER
ncbi:nucleotidyltransferase family protein [Chitinophaga eiseniae]|uniref:Nucleotidyltransferase n=1 Tax=Chitinophaga eiseniae TaxID=634771 RepID=A0A847SNU9_9BACT|nr:nucleotidyltransferase domain-containing protein [Chitinophaga eiseniae]NLR79096.1 nucleotidyltransferase [Chitinophaga eiseniae]